MRIRWCAERREIAVNGRQLVVDTGDVVDVPATAARSLVGQGAAEAAPAKPRPRRPATPARAPTAVTTATEEA